MPNKLGLLGDPRGEMRATPRNKLMGLLADALGSANSFATQMDPRYADKRQNQTLGLLADAVSLGSLAKTADRISYGEPLTNAGKANVPYMKPETADALMMAPLSPRNALAMMGAGMADNGMMKALGPVAKTAGDAERTQRMAQMGLEGGWYRGGAKPIDGKRTGPFYTKDAEEAAAYAQRYGAGGDVREYAIPSAGYLNAGAGYSSKLAHDVAKILDDPYYGKPGAQLAKELRTFGPNEGITGGQLWQALEVRYGNDGAADVLTKLGAFKGAKGITGPDEAYVFKNGAVRDAQKAQFDPSKYNVDNILAGVTGLGLLGGSAAMALRDRPSQD